MSIIDSDIGAVSMSMSMSDVEGEQLPPLPSAEETADGPYRERGSSNYAYTWARTGMDKFKQGDILGAADAFDKAVAESPTILLPQRAIALYCIGRYKDAASQLQGDVHRTEALRLYKATDLRLWLAACYFKLKLEIGSSSTVEDATATIVDQQQQQQQQVQKQKQKYLQQEQQQRALDALDAPNSRLSKGTGIVEDRPLWSLMLQFYAGKVELGALLDAIGGIGLPPLAVAVADWSSDCVSDENQNNQNNQIKQNRSSSSNGNRSKVASKERESDLFFGNFFLGLFFDATGNREMARSMLAFPRDSRRFPEADMWYHVPRALCRLAGYAD